MSRESRNSIPLVSVIVRSVNRPELLNALDSLSSQTYRNIELILVNALGDGQRFNTQAYEFPIRVIDTGSRLHRSVAGNKGLEAATGSYLLFLDDDDWLEPDHLSKLVQAIEKYPQMKVVYSAVKCVDSEGKALSKIFATPFDPVSLLAGNYIPIHSALFSRFLLDAGCKMDESLDLYEDWDFWIQASMVSEFLFVGGESAVYRIGQQSGFGIAANESIIKESESKIFLKWHNHLLADKYADIIHSLRDYADKRLQLVEKTETIVSLVREKDLQNKHIENLESLGKENVIHISKFQDIIAEKDRHLNDLQSISQEQNQHITNFQTILRENGQHIINFQGAILEKDKAIDHFVGQIDVQTKLNTTYQVQLLEKELALQETNRLLATKEQSIAEMSVRLAEDERQITDQEQTIAEKDICISGQIEALAEKDFLLSEQKQNLAIVNLRLVEQEQCIAERDSDIAKKLQSIAEKDQCIAEKDQCIAEKDQCIAEKDQHIRNIDALLLANGRQIESLLKSTSWRVTQPMRQGITFIRRIILWLTLISKTIDETGGFFTSAAKAIRVVRQEGVSGLRVRLQNKKSVVNAEVVQCVADNNLPAMEDKASLALVAYQDWIVRYDSLSENDFTLLRLKTNGLPVKPLISILMPVFNTPEQFLRKAIESVLAQVYPFWELCIADDASTLSSVKKVLDEYSTKDDRIKVVYREVNGHISAASNSALKLAVGDFVALLDHDDELVPSALYWIAKTINANRDVALIYSDEDKIDINGIRSQPYFKPEWNPDLFLSQNYICHFVAYKAEVVKSVGGFRVGLEGSQDYDLALRVIETISFNQINHVPKILYHWRMIPGSTALGGTDEKPYTVVSALKAINDRFSRLGVSAVALEANNVPGMYRVNYFLPANLPLVSIIIPTKNGLDILRQCIDSIVGKTEYDNYEIVIVDNGSDDPLVLDYFKTIMQTGVARVIVDDRPFNYAVLNNDAVKFAKGSVLAFLNNDVEVISASWLGDMVSQALRPEIGAVGARLWYPNDTLQHGGVILVCGVAGHAHKYLAKGDYGYFGRAVLQQNFSAVTAACLVLRRDVFQEVDGFDEKLAVAFNDVDLCLRIKKSGYYNTWTPYAELYHHESLTRGHENTPEKQKRFNDEVSYVQQRWGDDLLNDFAFNPNLDWHREDFSLAYPPRIGKF